MIRYTSAKPVKHILCDYLSAFCHSCAIRYNEVKLDALYLHEAPLYFKECESSILTHLMNPQQEFHLYMDTMEEDFVFQWKEYCIKAWFFTVNMTHFMLYQPADKAYYELFFILPKDAQSVDSEDNEENLRLLLKCIESNMQGI